MSLRMRVHDKEPIGEVLCKVLAHNLCCLIQEQEELGIAPVFWQNENEQANELPAILPMNSV